MCFLKKLTKNYHVIPNILSIFAPSTSLTTLFMKKAIVFCRVSTSGQSLDAQLATVKREALKDYADDELLVIEGIESAVSLDEEQRVTIQQLKEAIKQNPSIESVYFFAPDRLARRIRVAIDIIDDLTKMKVNMIFLNPMRINTLNEDKSVNAIAHLVLIMMAYTAEQEAKAMKCRIANKKAEMKRNHQVASGTLAYGYRKSEDKTIEVCEPQASIVRELFNLYATKQWSLITLHDHLATKDDSFFKLSSQSSTRACRVSAIIHNKLYSGNNNKNSNVYPPIVTPQLQEDCIAIANANLKGIRQNTKYVFYGKGLLRNYSDPRHRLLTAEIGQCCYRTNRDDNPTFMVSINAVDTILKGLLSLKAYAMGEVKERTIEDYSNKIEENNKAITTIQSQIDKLNNSNLKIETLLVKGKIRESIADEQKKVNNRELKQFGSKITELKTETQQLTNLIEASKTDNDLHAMEEELRHTTDDKLIKRYIDSVIEEVQVYHIDKYTKKIVVIGKPIVARHIVAHYIITSKGGQLKLTVVTPTNTWNEPIINRFSRKK